MPLVGTYLTYLPRFSGSVDHSGARRYNNAITHQCVASSFFLLMPVPIAFNACRANKLTLQTRVFVWDCDTIIWKKNCK